MGIQKGLTHAPEEMKELKDITLNKRFARGQGLEKEIQNFILSERLSKDEAEIPYMTASIKADQNVTMGIVTDVKTQLREVNALKINYSTKKEK